MARCAICGKESKLISELLRVCGECGREGSAGSRKMARAAHEVARKAFDLPDTAPRDPGGKPCSLCANACRIGSGKTGYCGVRWNRRGRITGGGPSSAAVEWYYDPLPTNCVADWVCPGGSAAGYPEYSYSKGPERGHKNLAVFYEACDFDCLFCQNWRYRERRLRRRRSADELARAVDGDTSCICYFGGDPTPQLPHALAASRKALEMNEGRILRICWETNGAMNPDLLKKMADLSLRSGGCIKFDLKAWTEGLHLALCGVSNKRVHENFRLAAQIAGQRPEPPLLVASTLLVPGYVMEDEVAAIARFIASLNPDIPYALLGFHPDFCMRDLPVTSRRHAMTCKEAAEAAGLRNVRIGNMHLLQHEDYER